MAVPTTDEMDKTTPEERNALVGLCSTCATATYFTRGVDKEVCSNGHGFDANGIISQRTYNPQLHKPKVRKR